MDNTYYIAPNAATKSVSARLVFPVAMACNMFATTGLLIFLGVLGYADFAAEVGIIQGATMAVFLAFSANARNLILADDDFSVRFLFCVRMGLLVPLALLSYFMSSQLIQISGWIVVLLIFRRGAEWLADLQISERERDGDQGYAWRFIVLQSFSFGLLVLTIVFHLQNLYRECFFFWSISPLLQVAPFFRRTLFRSGGGRIRLALFLPHLGSSWVIATSVYVFRVLVVLLVGKFMAGQLFSAYAIGGMVSSIYTYALGPSLIGFCDDRFQRSINWFTVIAVLFLFLGGGGVMFSSFFFPDRASLLLVVGFSLLGGGVMLVAQRKRIQILQIQKASTFVADIIINILLISAVHLGYYLFGLTGLYPIYLLSACLSCFFYYITYDGSIGPLTKRLRYLLNVFAFGGNRQALQALILFAFFFPLFFQLDGHFFNSTRMVYDSGGVLAQLPLPLAVVCCLLGIVLLLDGRRVVFGASVIFSFFLLLILSSLMISEGLNGNLLDKLIFLVQVIMPTFALLFGQSYSEPSRPILRFEGVFLLVLGLIIPAELLATYLNDSRILVPSLGFFSLYQHLQYLPVIFVGMYFLAINLKDLTRLLQVLGVFLAPLVGIYAVASISMLAIALTMIGCLITMFQWWERKFSWFIILPCLLMLLGTGWMIKDDSSVRGKFVVTNTGNSVQISEFLSLANINGRKFYWGYCWNGITESPQAFLLGHARRAERQTVPSAHNYYLDIFYTFGIFSLAPILYLLVYTAQHLWRVTRIGNVPPSTVHLAILVLFLVLIDNSFKVGLRQPYPGMITFFLWGVLLNRLRENNGVRA